ncbi:hypothetical protein BUALT_Bualt19G0108200 [Buddleja alternifolia]|uniref:Polyadenylate-binding protein n=1 Tax=Buddleja alternifolia TaxID=168488 RepID=A0AAV6W8R1_9LAMI|nr:hypothetical protein BUALT_Bualt19G0108200 [Buddleja alternifolia]
MAGEVNAAAETSVVQPVTMALYVGDLDFGVTEEELRRLFEQIGGVDSVKICTDQTTEQSLGYGYVNFSNPQHAAKALEDLNFTPLNGKRIRISYSNRDANMRISGAGNIFVKNLDEKIDLKALYEIFSSCGDIFSCKLETNATGHSKGYGFVQYTSDEAAKKAIDQLNGTLLHGKEVYVGPFISKQEREKANKFTNVFVKNLSESTNEEDLKITFGEFGSITSVVVIRGEDGNSKCFGFVNFENAEDAAKSVEVLNGHIVGGKEWYVGRAQKKFERERMLKLRYAQITTEAVESSLRLNNLYVKNLEDKIDDDKLKELFSPFGEITSCKVMCDPKGISKGSGFVAFSTSQEASKAISEMNGKMVGRKPLYVAVAERKETRKIRLQTARCWCSAAHCTNGAPAGHCPLAFQLMVHFFFAFQTLTELTNRLSHKQVLLRGNVNRFPPGYSFPNVTAQNTNGGMLSVARESGPSPVHDMKARRSVPIGGLASALTNASPAEQRRMLRENLYPLVEKMEHDMAGKVTDILLEMDQTEVLHLLESPESLRVKVTEAKEVIKNGPQQRPDTPSEQLASLVLNE